MDDLPGLEFYVTERDGGDVLSQGRKVSARCSRRGGGYYVAVAPIPDDASEHQIEATKAALCEELSRVAS